MTIVNTFGRLVVLDNFERDRTLDKLADTMGAGAVGDIT